jgi:hypothetical protein
MDGEDEEKNGVLVCEAERCTHKTAHGHRCRSLAAGESQYCVMHAEKLKRPKDRPVHAEAELLAELSAAAGSLASPDDVNRVLAKLFLALLEDRITREKAGTLGFLAHMLLRSHREIAFHKKLELQAAEKAQQAEALPISWNVPDARRGPVKPEDIARAEQKLADLKQQAVKEAAEAAAIFASNGGPGLHDKDVECGSPAAAVTVPSSSETEKREPGSGTPKAEPSTRNLPPPVVPPPPPQQDLNHFYPWGPTLPPGRQDPAKNTPPPDAEELRWRELSRQYASGHRREF